MMDDLMKGSDDNHTVGIIPVQSADRKLLLDMQSMKGAPLHVLPISGKLSREVFPGINSPSGPAALFLVSMHGQALAQDAVFAMGKPCCCITQKSPSRSM
jgi:hypothetical protein